MARAIRAVMSRLASRARRLGDEFPDRVWADLAKCGPDDALAELLTQWSLADARPLVLLIDEIDVLIGDALLAVLRQLRAGYDERPSGFPQSIALCGVRDVRDYRIHADSRNEPIAGAGRTSSFAARTLRRRAHHHRLGNVVPLGQTGRRR